MQWYIQLLFKQRGDHCILEKNWNMRFNNREIENVVMNGASSGPTFFNNQIGSRSLMNGASSGLTFFNSQIGSGSFDDCLPGKADMNFKNFTSEIGVIIFSSDPLQRTFEEANFQLNCESFRLCW